MSDLIFLYIHDFISFFNGGTNGQPPMAAMVAMAGLLNVLLMDVKQLAYYPSPTGEFTGSSIGHNYLRKNGMNLPIGALNRSLRDLSIGI